MKDGVKMSQKKRLRMWILNQGVFANHNIEDWARENGLLASTATRRAREIISELSKEGRISRISYGRKEARYRVV